MSRLSLVTLAETTLNILENAPEIATAGIDNYFYGDQDKQPGSRNICVEPDNKNNADYTGMNRLVMTTSRIFILVYSLNIGSATFNKKEADKTAEIVEFVLNKDPTLGGRVTSCYVTTLESGYRVINSTLSRVSRLTFEITNRERLGDTVV